MCPYFLSHVTFPTCLQSSGSQKCILHLGDWRTLLRNWLQGREQQSLTFEGLHICTGRWLPSYHTVKPTSLQALLYPQRCPVRVPVLHCYMNSTQGSPGICWKFLIGKQLLKGKRIIIVAVSCLHIKIMQIMIIQIKGKD